MSDRVRALVMLMVVGGLAACTPTTTGPMVMRLGPGLPDQKFGQVGFRAGPRLSAPQLSERGENDPFQGDAKPFVGDQWGLVFDGALTLPVNDRLSFHVGAQGEMFLVPVPAYGLYAGLSYYAGSPTVGLAPALSARGASDFGLNPNASVSSLFGLEASCAFSVQPEPGVSFGVVPFLNVTRSLVNPGSQETAVFYGGVVAAQFTLGTGSKVELSGGFGRAHVNGVSWNAPLAGLRGGR